MKRLIAISILLLYLLCPASLFEQAIVVKHKAVAVPTFVQSGNNYAVSGSSVTVPATGTITVSTGDIVVAACSNAASTASFTITNTGFTLGSWHMAPFLVGNGPSLISGFALVTSGGSGTFTCTPNFSTSYLGLSILDYSGGSSNTLNTSAVNANPSSSPVTISFTSTARTLNVLCACINAGVGFTAGTIGGVSATMRQSSYFPVCESNLTTTSVSGGTATMNFTSSNSQGAAQLLAISY